MVNNTHIQFDLTKSFQKTSFWLTSLVRPYTRFESKTCSTY